MNQIQSARSARKRLPNRRNSEIVAFEHEGRHYRASISRYVDGSIGEIFIDASKFGSDIAVHSNEAAILASVALQLGATPKDLQHSINGPLAAALGMFDEVRA